MSKKRDNEWKGNNGEKESDFEAENLPQASDGTDALLTKEQGQPALDSSAAKQSVLAELVAKTKVRRDLLDEIPIEEDNDNPFKNELNEFERDVNDFMTSDEPTASTNSNYNDDDDRDDLVNTESLVKELDAADLAQSTNTAPAQKNPRTNKRQRSRNDTNLSSYPKILPEALIPNDERGYEEPVTKKARVEKDSRESEPTPQPQKQDTPQKSWWEKLWDRFVSFVKDSYHYIKNSLNPNGTSSSKEAEATVAQTPSKQKNEMVDINNAQQYKFEENPLQQQGVNNGSLERRSAKRSSITKPGDKMTYTEIYSDKNIKDETDDNKGKNAIEELVLNPLKRENGPNGSKKSEGHAPSSYRGRSSSGAGHNGSL